MAATSARHERNPQVLKNDETFVLFDHFGDIQVYGSGDEGLYHEDTRYLSMQELTIDGVRPLFLGATVRDDNSLLVIELMNPDLTRGDKVRVAKGTVHLLRAKLLWDGACHEHVRVTNHGQEPFQAEVAMEFAADFADLFEVRGMAREHRGTRLEPLLDPQVAQLRYRGRDDVVRVTRTPGAAGWLSMSCLPRCRNGRGRGRAAITAIAHDFRQIVRRGTRRCRHATLFAADAPLGLTNVTGIPGRSSGCRASRLAASRPS